MKYEEIIIQDESADETKLLKGIVTKFYNKLLEADYRKNSFKTLWEFNLEL